MFTSRPAARYAGALRASTSFVLALARCGLSTLTPAAAPSLTGTCPGTPRIAHRTDRAAQTSRACQGSSEADPSRIK
jgi:hypothetical protein